MSEWGLAGAERQQSICHGDMGQRTAQRQKQLSFPGPSKNRQQFSHESPLRTKALTFLVVVAAAALVHVPGVGADETETGPKLPPHVADLRDVILSAARSGKIEELRAAFDVSASVPDLGISPRSDPIKTLKDRSQDPEGRDTLAALVNLMEMPPVALPLGNDLENNLIYVWPYLSMRALDKLTPAEQVDLYRLVTPELANEMRAKKRWLWWRVVIAADGSWTLFKKGN